MLGLHTLTFQPRKTYMSPSSKKDDGVVSEPLNMLQSAHNVESACQDDQRRQSCDHWLETTRLKEVDGVQI